jgi:HAD superfamily hydrolase (TIGR01509 family)
VSRQERNGQKERDRPEVRCRKPAALIFDMDGVLVDSEPVHVEATRRLLADYGVRYEARDDFFGFTDREVFRVLRARYRLPAGESALAERWIALVLALADRLVSLPGVPGVLERLKSRGFRLALASGSAPPVIDATLAVLGIHGLFEQVVSAKAVGRGKPAPDLFLVTAARLGLSPEACLVVEDSRNGLLAAVDAGMRCVVIPCASTSSQEFSEAVALLGTLAELEAWLEQGEAGGK